jgi:hypothetical protein
MSRSRHSHLGGQNLISAVPALRLQFLRDKMPVLSKTSRMPRFCVAALALFACIPPARSAELLMGPASRIIVSVRDQKLMFVQSGAKPIIYPVSTSRFGLGDDWGRMTTPLGFLQIVQKIGDNAPPGAVFHNRRWTGEILQPNAPGRDPIVTRIIWLRGLEVANAHAFNRCIYIHGTPQEKMIGRPASYGCIRMTSNDVAALFSRAILGTIVQIVPDHLPSAKQALTELAVPLVSAPPADGMTLVHHSEKSAPTTHKNSSVSGGRGA